MPAVNELSKNLLDRLANATDVVERSYQRPELSEADIDTLSGMVIQAASYSDAINRAAGQQEALEWNQLSSAVTEFVGLVDTTLRPHLPLED